MSMVELGNHSAKPKGSLLNPARQAIVAFVRANGESTHGQILQQLLDLNLATANGMAQSPHWLGKHLFELGAAGHVAKRTTEDGLVVWHTPEPLRPATTPVVVPRSTLFDRLQDARSAPSRVAGPRRVEVMSGVYTPPAGPPVRPGSMDHARLPSLMGSRRVPFRSVP